MTKLMAEKINDAIIEATKTEMPRDLIRWNAMRELLDSATGYINSTREERDKIEEQERFKEEEPEDEYFDKPRW